MIPPWVVTVFERFGELLSKEANNRGFALVDRLRGNQPAERHGAWDWTYAKPGRDLTRYFTIGLRFPIAPVSASGSDGMHRTLLLDACAGGDTLDRFVKRQVVTMSVREDQLRSNWDVDLWKALRSAIDAAEALTVDDLVETYDIGLKR